MSCPIKGLTPAKKMRYNALALTAAWVLYRFPNGKQLSANPSDRKRQAESEISPQSNMAQVAPWQVFTEIEDY
jgi:hypothetical protein